MVCLSQVSILKHRRPYAKYLWLFGLLAFAALNGCSRQTQPVGSGVPIPDPVTDNKPQTPDPVVNAPFPDQKLVWTESVRSPVTIYESQGLATNGYLYVFGGYDNKQIQASLTALAFDPATKRWHNLAPMPEEITHAGQALYNNKIYLAGGFVGDHPGPPTDHVWMYDIATDTWSTGPTLPQKIGGGALVNLEGQLHFFGGTVRKGSNYLRDNPQHWVLDVKVDSKRWVEAAALPNPRNHIAGAALDGKVYAVGGQLLGDEETGNQTNVDVYDPTSNSWRPAADLPQPLGHISAATFAYRGRLVVVMGVTQGRGKSSEIITYNPVTDSWDHLTNMPGARSATVAGVVDGEIVLSTGIVGGDPLDTTWIGSWPED